MIVVLVVGVPYRPKVLEHPSREQEGSISTADEVLDLTGSRRGARPRDQRRCRSDLRYS